MAMCSVSRELLPLLLVYTISLRHINRKGNHVTALIIIAWNTHRTYRKGCNMVYVSRAK